MGSKFPICPGPFSSCEWPHRDTALTTTHGDLCSNSHPLEISAGPHAKLLNVAAEDQRLWLHKITVWSTGSSTLSYCDHRKLFILCSHFLWHIWKLSVCICSISFTIGEMITGVILLMYKYPYITWSWDIKNISSKVFKYLFFSF